MEAASLRLQKEAKGYLDSLRGSSMTPPFPMGRAPLDTSEHYLTVEQQ